MINKGRTRKLQKKALKITTFMIIASAMFLIVNIGSYYVLAKTDNSYVLFTNENDSAGSELGSNVNEIISPPLGNETTLPKWTTMFSLMALLLPIEIVIVFSAEIILGTSLKLDPKKKNLQRLGIMLGSSAALSVFGGIIHYLLVYPAIHDIPIHKYTFIIPGTDNQTSPQYGIAQTFYGLGVDVVLLALSMLLILGLHFLAFKFIQGFNWTSTSVSTGLGLIFFPSIWAILIKQVTEKEFIETTGSLWTIMTIIACGFILFLLLLLLWKLTLVGTAPKMETEQQKYQGE